MDMLAKAVEFAAFHHAGQTDKAGQPYILHPLRVMAAMDNHQDRIVAVLHDTLEDTNLRLNTLRAHRFTDEILAALNAITRCDGEKYFDYIDRLSKNECAVRVKIADLHDNMDKSRIPNWSEKDQARHDRYKIALEKLTPTFPTI